MYQYNPKRTWQGQLYTHIWPHLQRIFLGSIFLLLSFTLSYECEKPPWSPSRRLVAGRLSSLPAGLNVSANFSDDDKYVCFHLVPPFYMEILAMKFVVSCVRVGLRRRGWQQWLGC